MPVASAPPASRALPAMMRGFSLPRGRWLNLLLLGFLPLTALWLVGTTLFDIAHTRSLRATEELLHRRLAEVAIHSLPRHYYFLLCRALAARCRSLQTQGRLTRLPATIDRLRRQWGVTGAWYLFDAQGRLIAVPGVPQPHRFVVGKLWDSLARTPAYRPGDEHRHAKKIRSLLGPQANIGNVSVRPGRIMDIRWRKRDGFLYWERFSPDSCAGVLFLIDPILPQTRLLRHLYRIPGLKGLQTTIWEDEGRGVPFGPKLSFDPVLLRRLLEQNAQRGLTTADRHWAITSHRRATLLMSIPRRTPDILRSQGPFQALLLVVGLFVLGFAYHQELGCRPLFLSIGVKVLGILVLAILLPLSGILLLGVDSLEDHRQVGLTRTRHELDRLAANLDGEFAGEIRRFAHLSRQLEADLLATSTFDSLCTRMDRLVAEGRLAHYELRSLDGSLLRRREHPGKLEGLAKVLDTFSRHSLAKQNAARLQREDISVKRPPDPMIEDVLESSEMGFPQLVTGPGTPHHLTFSDNQLYFFWNFVAQDRHPVGYFCCTQSVSDAQQQFLTRVLARAHPGPYRLAAYNHETHRWVAAGPAPSPPCRFLMNQAWAENQPVLRPVSLGGERVLALAFPGTLLAPYSLLITTPAASVARSVNRQKAVLIGSILLVLLVTLAIGRLLRAAFLVPIQALDQGMRALQRREARVAVTIETHDELGDLGRTFNRVVEDLREMELARVVQERLFPTQIPQIPGYEIGMFNLPASNLGGDYCDMLPLHDGTWLFLIGDVTGHGTPAALCMAMVKAAVFQFTREDVPPEELPQRLTHLLAKVIQRKKLMTMLFLHLDPTHGTLTEINAGHNWPILLKADGTLEEHELVGFPLGIKSRRLTDNTRTIRLQPGETVFTYTDALREAADRSGRPVDDEVLHALLLANRHLTPQALIAVITDFWHAHIDGQAPEDDLTLLVLRRGEEDA